MDFLIDMYLRGYKIMGINKVDRMLALQLAKRRYEDFKEDFKDNQKAIAAYFTLGIEAKAFSDHQTGKILVEKDDIWTSFADNKYLYTLRRQPLVSNQNGLINNLLRGL